ncbi:UNVERIFIED_CONTAM: 2-polyprenyl-3-methyl-5-hydroxy-6-metoxy-1,4-benzoquinol methylase [Paenibacillus sp. PvR008]
MANRDQVNERYYGQMNSEESHEATRNRIHWICRHVQGHTVLDAGCSQGITSIDLIFLNSNVRPADLTRLF